MRPFTPQEKRTVRVAGIGLAVYLVLFFGLDLWSSLQKRRSAYLKLVREAEDWKKRLTLAGDKAIGLEGLMEQFKFDPAKLSTNNLVADAVSALHNAAVSGGLQLGPVRETASRGTARELATVQIEGMGPVPAVLSFLQDIGKLGFPMVADSVQLASERSQPGATRMTVTVVILNVEQSRGTTRRPDA